MGEQILVPQIHQIIFLIIRTLLKKEFLEADVEKDINL